MESSRGSGFSWSDSLWTMNAMDEAKKQEIEWEKEEMVIENLGRQREVRGPERALEEFGETRCR